MYRPRLSLPASGLPHEEIFEDKLALPRRQRTTAHKADYLAGICLRPGFDFDDLVERGTTRAGERIKLATHDTPSAYRSRCNSRRPNFRGAYSCWEGFVWRVTRHDLTAPPAAMKSPGQSGTGAELDRSKNKPGYSDRTLNRSQMKSPGQERDRGEVNHL
jgi:hypothetical protein